MAEAHDDLPNLGILIKLMKMTTSSHDHEALAAVRKANQALTKFGGDWEALLRGKVTVIGDPFDSIPQPESDRPRAKPAPPPRPQPPPHHPLYQPAPPPRPRARPAAPPPPPPQPAKPVILRNKFSSYCKNCGDVVAVNDGWVFKPSVPGGKWTCFCDPCHTNSGRIKTIDLA